MKQTAKRLTATLMTCVLVLQCFPSRPYAAELLTEAPAEETILLDGEESLASDSAGVMGDESGDEDLGPTGEPDSIASEIDPEESEEQPVDPADPSNSTSMEDPADEGEDASDDETPDEVSEVRDETTADTELAEAEAAVGEPEQNASLEAEDNKDVSTQSAKPGTKAARPSLSVQAHVQNVGWKDPVGSGKLAGTTGRSLRVEAFRISLDGNGAKLPAGSIEYRAHVQNIGWQDWKANGKLAGTTNRSLRIEALMVRLTGELAEQYDVYYQSHVENLGWMALASNGEASGSAGRSLRVEGIRVWLVKKGSAAPSAPCDTNRAFSGLLGLSSQVHVQNLGWIWGSKSSGVVGTTGRGLRLEALRLNTSGLEANGSIQYRAHVQNIGWQGWRSDGQLAGTVGRGLRIEAVQVRLTDDLKDAYDIYYRVHVGDVGWLAWTKNGSPAGTNGLAMRIEAIQFAIVDKGAAAPTSQGDVSFAFLENTPITYTTDVIGSGWQGWKRSGTSGTVGQAEAIDGLGVKVVSEDAPGGIRYAVRPSGGSWSDWHADGSKVTMSGKAVGSLKIELTGELSKVYNVWYRVHLSNVGWLGWAKNGQVAGNVSSSKALCVEAIQVRLIPKSQSGPGVNRGYTAFDRLSGDALVDEFVWTTIDKHGWSGASGLETAYNYVVTTFPYKSGTNWYGDNASAHLVSFAHEMVANHGGNCHRYAALVYWFGKALGCPLTPMAGKLGGLNGTNHGWLERKVNGVVYVVDPAVEVVYPEYDWYLVRYKDARIKYYDRYGNRILK